MSDTLTNERLKELSKVAEAAAAGPWEGCNDFQPTEHAFEKTFPAALCAELCRELRRWRRAAMRAQTRSGAKWEEAMTDEREEVKFCRFHGHPLPCSGTHDIPGPPAYPVFCERCGLKLDTCNFPGPWCKCKRPMRCDEREEPALEAVEYNPEDQLYPLATVRELVLAAREVVQGGNPVYPVSAARLRAALEGFRDVE